MTIPNDQESIKLELAAIVWRLLRALKKADPNHELISKVKDFMTVNGLANWVMRRDNGGEEFY